tara:strand:+ start:1323 stop:1538 length:216 start_codon:yes stop_codon:yes gene_type:complete
MFNSIKSTELKSVTLNPLCPAFKNYKFKLIDEPYLTIFNEIAWRKVYVPQTAIIKGKNINDLTSYNLKLKH